MVNIVIEQASDWLRDHVAADAQWFVSALVVEPRDVADIINGARRSRPGRGNAPGGPWGARATLPG